MFISVCMWSLYKLSRCFNALYNNEMDGFMHRILNYVMFFQVSLFNSSLFRSLLWGSRSFNLNLICDKWKNEDGEWRWWGKREEWLMIIIWKPPSLHIYSYQTIVICFWVDWNMNPPSFHSVIVKFKFQLPHIIWVECLLSLCRMSIERRIIRDEEK